MPEIPITPGSPGRSANEDTHMDDAPPVNSTPARPSAEIPYNREFEDSIMRAILDPPPTNEGIESHGRLPAFLLGRDTVPHEELPLPLDDPRRQFRSAIPGIKLTHPTGAYEGGNPDATDEDRAWTRDWIARNGIRTKEDLERARADAIREELDEMRRRARARQDAIAEREKIEKELKALNDQREVELKAQRSIIEKARAKKEERRAKRTKLAAPPVDEASREQHSSSTEAKDDAERAGSAQTQGVAWPVETSDSSKTSASAGPSDATRRYPPTAPASMRATRPSHLSSPLASSPISATTVPSVARKGPPLAPASMRMGRSSPLSGLHRGNRGMLPAQSPTSMRMAPPTAPASARMERPPLQTGVSGITRDRYQGKSGADGANKFQDFAEDDALNGKQGRRPSDEKRD